MKIRHFMFVSAILLFAFTACEKAFWKKDFRDKYVGKYQVTEEKRSYGPYEFGDYIRDTLIIVDYGNSDSLLVVLEREVKPDKDGYYRTYGHEVRFRNDSILSEIKNGGLGAGYFLRHKGKRVSSKP